MGDAEVLTALIRGDPKLYARLHDFNLLPSRGMHPSWHPLLYPAPAQALLGRAADADARAHARLSQYLLESGALGGRTFWEVTAPLSIALLAPDALLDFVRRIGAGLASARLRGSLPSTAAAALRRALGDAAHDFALQRAPLLVAPGDLEWEPIARVDAAAETVRTDVDALGAATLRSYWDATEGLWARARVKLPLEVAEAAERLPPAPAAASSRLTLRIARESNPRWLTSFAPASA